MERILPHEQSDVAGQMAHVERYATFIGYPRSGHSLVGSLLDAHPDIIISHELDALEFVSNGAERHAIWSAILQNSRNFARSGRKWEQYTYGVPGQWNGRFRELRVIGDKKGGRSTIRLGDRPELLAALRGTMLVRCQFIHVIRNPYDNISTIARRSGMDLADAVEDYFRRCATVRQLRTQLPEQDWYDIRHEALVADSPEQLRRLCLFLGQSCDEGYLQDCASVVFASPHQSRGAAPWTRDLIRRVQERMADFAFLQDYTFEG